MKGLRRMSFFRSLSPCRTLTGTRGCKYCHLMQAALLTQFSGSGSEGALICAHLGHICLRAPLQMSTRCHVPTRRRDEELSPGALIFWPHKSEDGCVCTVCGPTRETERIFGFVWHDVCNLLLFKVDSILHASFRNFRIALLRCEMRHPNPN